MINLFPSLGHSFSMKRYLEGLKTGLEANGIQYTVVRPNGNSWISKYFNYPLIARKKNKSHCQNLIISERYAYLTYFLGFNSIVVCHDLHTLYPESGTPRIHKFIYRFFLRSMYRANRVICISNHTKNDLLKFYPKFIQHSGLEVLHNGIEDGWINGFEKIEIKPDWFRIFDRNKILLSIGTDAWYKNNSESLRLLASLNDDFHLLRIGGFNKANKALIKFLEIEERITEVHDIPDNYLKFSYENSNALLFPSISEGYGWPVVEAILCGCQVITTDVGAMPELLTDGQSWVSWGEALSFLLGRLDKDLPEISVETWENQVKKLIIMT